MSDSISSGTTDYFHVDNGQIIAPDGTVFTARGIDIFTSAGATAQLDDALQILADFPGINFVRVACYYDATTNSWEPPSDFASFIQTMTSAGVVVELEDHYNGSNANTASAYAGSILAAETAWYASVASAYASDPYVWFGTANEPPANGLAAWQQDTYEAIRNTGNLNPVLIELPGGGWPGGSETQGMTPSGTDPSVYQTMTNIVFDVHFYGWSSGYSTNQGTVDATLTGLVQGAQSITSAGSSTVPVIVGEYGISTNGTATDANALQVLQAVQTATDISGAVAWNWDSTGTSDNLTVGTVSMDGSVALTWYGTEVARWISAEPAPEPSPDDTVIKAGSTAAITDVVGDEWTITSGGQVAVDGVPDTSTANVIEIAYVNGTIWQENTHNRWYAETAPGAGWTPDNGTKISPLPGCFAAGTRIEVQHGHVPVESLAVGDLVFSPRLGRHVPAIWIGHRHVDCARHPHPERVLPVRIAAETFGPGIPLRDLSLSPDHALFVDGVLIPVRYLINGTSIAQVRVADVTYYHVELPTHDLLLAEGVAAESYLDVGDRDDFANGGGTMRLFPNFAVNDMAEVWEAKGCAPLVINGPILEAARSRLNAPPPPGRHAA